MPQKAASDANSRRDLDDGLALGRQVFRHLPYFLVVAQEQNFHRAAAILHVTQPALSRRIRALEEALGVKLFDRTQRGAVLTPAGEVFAKEARTLVTDLERAAGRAAAITRGEEGHLRIGLNEGAFRSELVKRVLRAFQAASPRIRLELIPLLTEEQVVALDNGTIDAGFVYDIVRDERFSQRYDSLAIGEQAMVLAIPAKHRLAKAKRLSVTDLRDEPLMWPSRERGRHLYDRMIACFQKRGVSPRIAMEILAGDMTVNMAEAGLGLGFVSADQKVPRSVVLRSVEGFDVSLHLEMVWRRANDLAAMARLVEAFRPLVGRGIKPKSVIRK